MLSIDEKAGVITARVQGSRPTPYKVTIHLAPFTDAQWQAVIDGLAERAIFSAQLLAGEMPREIEEAFSAVGLSLFPARTDELVTNCTCPDWANPCKHVAATHYILGEQFDEDPFLLFRLRGRSQEQIIAALRARRAAEAERVAQKPRPAQRSPSHPRPYTVDAPSLEESLEKSSASFWQLGGSLEHFPTGIHPPAAPLAVLRRLGRPGFVDQDLEQLLGPLYEEASRRALALAFHDDETRTGGERRRRGTMSLFDYYMENYNSDVLKEWVDLCGSSKGAHPQGRSRRVPGADHDLRRGSAPALGRDGRSFAQGGCRRLSQRGQLQRRRLCRPIRPPAGTVPAETAGRGTASRS